MDAQPAAAAVQKKPRIYRGKPQNQIDPQAQNEFVPPNLQKRVNIRRKPTRGAMPKALPKPIRLGDEEDIKAKAKIVEKSPLMDSVFAENVTVREINLRTLQRSSLAASISVAKEIYTQLLIDDSNINKSWTLEVFEYYATSRLWMRMCTFKALEASRTNKL